MNAAPFRAWLHGLGTVHLICDRHFLNFNVIRGQDIFEIDADGKQTKFWEPVVFQTFATGLHI